MAVCYNCGKEISADNKTRLCDDCGKIIQGFVRLTGMSSASSIRMLLGSEKELRAKGITDKGIEYLYKVCEKQDAMKRREKEEARKANNPSASSVKEQEEIPEKEEPITGYELPAEERLNIRRKNYGKYLTAVKIALIAIGAVCLVWFGLSFVMNEDLELTSMFGSLTSFACAYLADVMKSIITDFDEIKKRFR